VYGTSVIAALTAQNTRGVSGVFDVPPAFITAQLEAVFSDFDIGAVKIGMLSNAAAIAAVAAALTQFKARNIVLDPVMFATSGDRLLRPDAISTLRKTLFPLATVITPNLPEAGAFLDAPVATDERTMREQGEQLRAMGAPAVLIKGGHGESDEAVDLLIEAGGCTRLAVPRLVTRHTHGTGCTLSSAIAAGLAKGKSLNAAVREAKDYITAAIAGADRLAVGHGHGPVHHFHRWWHDAPAESKRS
jgi:hydroxymethylpyrimidine/phosphomethylpyrimidine kinase